MIIWKGNGILVPVSAALGGVAGSLAAIAIHPPSVSIGGAIGGASLLWLYASTLGKTTEQHFLDPATHQPITIKSHHTLYFIPVKAWAVVGVVVALGLIVMDVMGPRKSLVPKPPGYEKAESFIGQRSGDVAAGNTDLAKRIAVNISAAITKLRSEAISKGGSSNKFRTFCQVTDEGVAVLIHVPDLRKFTDGAKETMVDIAWVSSSTVVANMLPECRKLTVGAKGIALFEAILTGTPGADITQNPRAGVTRTSKDEDDLAVYFKTPTAPTAATPSLKPEPTAPPPAAAAPVVQPPTPPVVTPASSEAAESMPTPTPSAAAPTPPQALPTPVQNWTSGDGRVMRASLVRFLDAEGKKAEFRREDGATFEVSVERFDPVTQAEIARLHQAAK